MVCNNKKKKKQAGHSFLQSSQSVSPPHIPVYWQVRIYFPHLQKCHQSSALPVLNSNTETEKLDSAPWAWAGAIHC